MKKKKENICWNGKAFLKDKSEMKAMQKLNKVTPDGKIKCRAKLRRNEFVEVNLFRQNFNEGWRVLN